MSNTQVEVLEAKLDILIGDFRLFRKWILTLISGLLVVGAIPTTVWFMNKIIEHGESIAIIKCLYYINMGLFHWEMH